MAWAFFREGSLRDRRDASVEAALKLHRAGVPLLVGSDGGSWPVDPFRYHAVTTLREIALLAEAGLAPAQILVAATSAPAAMLGREGELGALTPGARADLVLLDGDPLRDISAFERVRWTIRDGVARTPEEWMKAGGQETGR